MSAVVPDRSGRARPAVLWAVGLCLFLGSALYAVQVGASGLGMGEVWEVIRARLAGGHTAIDPIDTAIIWELRVPRVLLSAVCGAGLAVCGVVLQSLLRNPLADPFMLGISSGAGLGAMTVFIAGVGSGVVSLATGAFAGAVLTFALVLLLARLAGRSIAVLILAGVAIAQLCSAMTSFIIIALADANETRGVLFWLMGSLSPARWDDIPVTAVTVGAGIAVCVAVSSMLDAFTFGEDAAAALGIRVARVRGMLLVVTALITAVLVSRVGAIGFVGLTLPHAARAVVGVKHRVLVPASALLGAIFLVWVDAVARVSFAPQEIPVGVMTALIGVPAFVVILVRQGQRRGRVALGGGR
ncbi:MAG: iron chelate uptake ABC transporter family permease subunit [Patulibacter sp.]